MKKNGTEHAHIFIYCSKEILNTNFNVIGKMELLGKNRSKIYRKCKWLIDFITLKLKSL